MTRQTAQMISRALARRSPQLRRMIAEMPARTPKYWLKHAVRAWIFAGSPETRLPCA
jgi:hypothetical protein